MVETTPAPDDEDRPTGLPGYDILNVAGYDGLGVVYRARKRSLNRVVALRTIRGEAGPEETAQSLRGSGPARPASAPTRGIDPGLP
jgi:hypothetical protein